MRFLPAKIMFALGLSGSLLLVACGGEVDSDTRPPIPSVSAPASTPAVTPSPDPSASSTSKPRSIEASNNLDAVTVTGGYGKLPKVQVKAPWAIDETKTEIIASSDGPALQEGQPLTFNYVGVNGRTGKVFDDSFSRGEPITFPIDQLVPGFQTGMVGKKQGSRVVMAIPGKDGYDASGGRPDSGIEIGDTLIFVVDLVTVPLGGPEGSTVEPEAGLPTVTGPVDKPEITIPKADPPTKLVVQPLIEGKGRKVAASDTITFAYRWEIWEDGRLVEQSYGSKPGSAQLSGLVAGLQEGLVGQTVGSRVLLVIPPDKGYPDGNAEPKVAKGETLVMVVDLLFAQAAQ